MLLYTLCLALSISVTSPHSSPLVHLVAFNRFLELCRSYYECLSYNHRHVFPTFSFCTRTVHTKSFISLKQSKIREFSQAFYTMGIPAIETHQSFAALNGVMLALSVIAVALRFYSRSLQKAALKADDWVMIPAIVSSKCTDLASEMEGLERILTTLFLRFRLPGYSFSCSLVKPPVLLVS